MTRLHSTGHTPRLFAEFEAADLTAKIEVDHVWIGWNHPVLPFQNLLKTFSEEQKLKLILGSDTKLERYKHFWDNYQHLSPEHEVFKTHSGHLQSVIPVLLHADEGTGQKKRPLMVIQAQGLLGGGSSRGKNDLNYVGNSIMARFLYTVIPGRLYADKHIVRLRKLISTLASDLTSLFYDGIELAWEGLRRNCFFACLGMKGDWPALTKFGRLTRHHLRDGKQQVGICHLCKAGMADYPWHHSSFAELDRMHQDVPGPWDNEPSSLLQVPQDWSNPAAFYHIDVFHCFHKGIAGDFCANAIVP